MRKKKIGSEGVTGDMGGLFCLYDRGYDEDRNSLGPGHHTAPAFTFAAQGLSLYEAYRGPVSCLVLVCRAGPWLEHLGHDLPAVLRQGDSG